MVKFYYLIDLIIVFFIIYGSYKSYKNKLYLKIFEYLKIFLLITISAKLASYTGISLQKLYITKADTYTTLILIGFSVNLLLIYYSWKYIFKYTNKFINSNKLRSYLAIVVSFLEVLILTTFTLYISMQIYLSKKFIYPHLIKSYSYTKIEKFYISFLNDDFVNMILNSDTGTNRKEVIFKSFKNSL